MKTREFEEFVSEVTTAIEQFVAHSSEATMLTAAAPMTETATPNGWPVHAYVVDYEKVVWHFPDASARLIEDVV